MDPPVNGRAIKEVEFTRVQDAHYYLGLAPVPIEKGIRERLHQPYLVAARRDPNRLLVSADTLAVRHEPFSADSLMARLREAPPDAPIVDTNCSARTICTYTRAAGRRRYRSCV